MSTNVSTNGVKAAAPPPPKRMSLNKVTTGRIEVPHRILLYGTEGIGKTTFVANAPKPIFLSAEEGTSQLDVARLPQPQTWEDVLEAVHNLATEQHDYQTLGIDTLDAIEPLVWSFICERDGKKSIEDYGYGKGYTAAIDEWRVLLAGLERLRATKRMHIVMLAHAWIRPFKNPLGDDYDRYELKLHAKSAGLLKEWCDEVLFANYETYAHKDEKTKRVRGVSTGARLLFTERTAAYDAKNRHSLPESVALSWSEFAEAARRGAAAAPAAVRAEIERKAKEIGGDKEPKILAALAAITGDDAQALALLNNRVNATLAAMNAEKDS